jgi:hypothetical protein
MTSIRTERRKIEWSESMKDGKTMTVTWEWSMQSRSCSDFVKTERRM